MLGFLSILLIHQILIFFVNNSLNPIHFASKNFLLLELIDKQFYLNFELLFILDGINLTLLWLIGRQIFKSKFSVIPPIIYAIVPWSSYLVVANSFYIYLTFTLMITVYGLLILGSWRKLGSVLLIIGVLLSIYSSLLLLIMMLFILLLVAFRLITIKNMKALFVIIFFLATPLFFLMFTNQSAVENIFSNEIGILSDPGLINSVNSYQGAARSVGFGDLARVSENKYIFIAEYILQKYIKSFIPTTYFTSSEKLLSFSFSPPIYLGFLIPFMCGLYLVLQSSIFLRRCFLLTTILVIPSMLSKSIVDLNRMIIFSPVVIFVITYGITSLAKQRKKISNFFLIMTLFLVILQLLVTLSDIRLKEKERFQRYFKQDYQIGKQ